MFYHGKRETHLSVLKSRGKWFSGLLFSLSLLICRPVFAQSLVILDCQGITRAIHETRGTQLNRVEIEVSEPGGVPGQGREVRLVNNVTGETFTAVADSGQVVFDSLPLGNYSMLAEGTNLTVGTITIGASSLGLAAGGLIVGSTLVGGGIAVDQVDQHLNNQSDATPVPTPEPANTPGPEPSPPLHAPTPTPTPCDCDPDAEPTPIDDFFDRDTRSAAQLSPFS